MENNIITAFGAEIYLGPKAVIKVNNGSRSLSVTMLTIMVYFVLARKKNKIGGQLNPYIKLGMKIGVICCLFLIP